MKIYFDKNNSNCLVFEFKNKKGRTDFYYMAIPPGKNRTDIFDSEGINRFNIIEHEKHYIYNFEGFIVMTTDTERVVYKKSKLICKTKI